PRSTGELRSALPVSNPSPVRHAPGDVAGGSRAGNHAPLPSGATHPGRGVVYVSGRLVCLGQTRHGHAPVAGCLHGPVSGRMAGPAVLAISTRRARVVRPGSAGRTGVVGWTHRVPAAHRRDVVERRGTARPSLRPGGARTRGAVAVRLV